MKTKTCESCIFYDETRGGVRVCRRHAPVIKDAPFDYQEQTGYTTVTVFPFTRPDAYCGDWNDHSWLDIDDETPEPADINTLYDFGGE